MAREITHTEANEKVQEKNVFGFIGLGLIGGTIARALRGVHPNAVIKAHTRRKETVEEAIADGVVDEYVQDPIHGFTDCDVIFLCAPVSFNNSYLAALAPHLGPGTLITDVGSTKTEIHDLARSLHLERQFIGGHPMAGSERVGYRNARETLIENAYYILAPEPEVPKEEVAWMRAFVEAIHAIPIIIDPGEHDFVVAGVSHLPHVISASLVNLVHDSDNKDGIMRTVAAGGFKDITRISSSSAEMWQQICLTNTDNIRVLLDRYIESLETFREELVSRDENYLYNYFDQARQYRESFSDAASGPLPQSFYLNVEIEDRPGVLAEVVMYLAIAGINIKNIGITHNREYQEGVLRVECHSADGLAKARELLQDRNYKVY